MTRNNKDLSLIADHWNEYNLKNLISNNWRTSLVPAPAVIPAPIIYTKVVAVKKLVVEFKGCRNLNTFRLGYLQTSVCGSLTWGVFV